MTLKERFDNMKELLEDIEADYSLHPDEWVSVTDLRTKIEEAQDIFERTRKTNEE